MDPQLLILGDEAAALQPTVMPWQCMQFQLMDCVNGYAAERQEIDGSCIVLGQVGSFNMGSFPGLVNYVREAFEIDLELNLPLAPRESREHEHRRGMEFPFLRPSSRAARRAHPAVAWLAPGAMQRLRGCSLLPRARTRRA